MPQNFGGTQNNNRLISITMKTKKYNFYGLYFIGFFLLCNAFIACSDWVDVEAKMNQNKDKSMFTDDYYERLRAYKKSDHAVSFGWFGNWTGKGASLYNSMAGLPDSVDFISMWGSWRNPTQEQLSDLRFVQEIKGTKALMCFIIDNVGVQLTPKDLLVDEDGNDLSGQAKTDVMKKYWGWDPERDEESMKEAIQNYANAICDTIEKYNYDGFDIDYEPNYGAAGNLSSIDKNMLVFIETLAQRIGPKSGTDRLLVIDGEPQTVVSESGPCFNYFIVQAYHCSGDRDLDNRLASTIRNFEGILSPEKVASMYIVTENFESYAPNGGVRFTDSNGNVMQSLEGMARWNPTINGKKIRKGGLGTFHMEYEFTIPGRKGTYPYLRNAIRLMNPSVK
jgi:hypothetical protein